MKRIDRRSFIKDMGRYAGGIVIGGYFLDSFVFNPSVANAAKLANVYIAKNGTPAENVAKVIEMRFGGIENFIGADDVVVINPNGQWPRQGASNCECCMGLIDLILNRPGGFTGEIIFTENTQNQEVGYWICEEYLLERNGPYNFMDMIAYYHSQGHNNVNGVRLWCNYDDPINWPLVSGPQEGKQGWDRYTWVSPTNNTYTLSNPIIRSPYSNRLIDLKNGVYDNGYEGQPALKFIKMPTLNNHGDNAQQDYAGITSAIKSFLGISELRGVPHEMLHNYSRGAYEVGLAVGGWINTVRKPDIFLTTAEWVGWGDRETNLATQARTVGLGDDPVSLDYIMSKYVLWPTHPEAEFFNPDWNLSENISRQTMNGCQAMGFGTTNEEEINAFIYDHVATSIFRFDIDRKIHEFRNGTATEQEVLDLIEQYNTGK
ncbi:MAG: hypothetical protein ABIJ45_04660 [Candidatus Zixiibacteriota bacterium]